MSHADDARCARCNFIVIANNRSLLCCSNDTGGGSESYVAAIERRRCWCLVRKHHERVKFCCRSRTVSMGLNNDFKEMGKAIWFVDDGELF